MTNIKTQAARFLSVVILIASVPIGLCIPYFFRYEPMAQKPDDSNQPDSHSFPPFVPSRSLRNPVNVNAIQGIAMADDYPANAAQSIANYSPWKLDLRYTTEIVPTYDADGMGLTVQEVPTLQMIPAWMSEEGKAAYYRNLDQIQRAR